ncbi:MAG: TIM barrel protein [Candidatus Bathyarchaeia archaeon]
MAPKVGMSIYSYGANIVTRRMTIKECIEHAASLGVEGIELVDNRNIPNFPYQSVYDLEDLREHIESFGMRVSCYSPYLEEPHGRLLTLEQYLKVFRKFAAEAAFLRTNIIRPHFYILGFPRDEETLNTWFNMIKKIVSMATPYLEKYDLIWGAEIHAPFKTSWFIKLAKEINSERFGLVPDFSCWEKKDIFGPAGPHGGEEPVDTLRECLPYTVHVHAKAHMFDEKGEEPNIPYDKLITILKDGGFNGYISAEYEGFVTGDYIDSRITAKKHIELIKRYLK